MTPQRTAAIDAILDTPLEKLNAADFLTALGHQEAAELRPILADKKKYELWVEEAPILKFTLKELLDRMRVEKKKVELEIDPWQPKPVRIPHPIADKKKLELEVDPPVTGGGGIPIWTEKKKVELEVGGFGGSRVQSDAAYAQLVQDVATAVEERMK